MVINRRILERLAIVLIIRFRRVPENAHANLLRVVHLLRLFMIREQGRKLRVMQPFAVLLHYGSIALPDDGNNHVKYRATARAFLPPVLTLWWTLDNDWVVAEGTVHNPFFLSMVRRAPRPNIPNRSVKSEDVSIGGGAANFQTPESHAPRGCPRN